MTIMGRSPNADRGYKKRNERVEMCLVPLFSEQAVFSEWISEFDCWFMKFDSWPLSDLLGKLILLLKANRAKDREAVGLIERKMSNRQNESFKIATPGRKDFVVINRQRLLDLLEVHYKQSAGQVLSEIRHQIKSSGKIAPIELGEVGKTRKL